MDLDTLILSKSYTNRKLNEIASNSSGATDGLILTANGDGTSTFKEQLPNNGMRGIAESGGSGTLIDSTKDFASLHVIGKTIAIMMDDKTYYRDVLDTVEDQIIFTPLPLGGSASATINGSGTDIYTGGVTIDVIEPGADGNLYSVELVAGTGISSMESVSLVGNVLTITSGTTVDEEPVAMWAGSIQSLINNTAGVNEIFASITEITAGAIEFTTEAIQFSGGSETVVVEAGTRYFIWNDENALTEIVNDFSGGVEKLASAEIVKTLNESVVHNTGEETIAGVKTFVDTPIIPITDTDENFTATDVEGALAELANTKLSIGSNSDLIEEGDTNKYYTAEEKALVATKTELAEAVFSGVADNSVSDAKLTANAKRALFIPGNTLPNYDTATLTLQLCEDIDINAQLIYNNTRYDIPYQTRVLNTRPGINSKFIFNVDTQVFKFIHPTTALATNEIMVGTFKNLNGASTSDWIDLGGCEVTINNSALVKTKLFNSRALFIPGNTLPNYDTATLTLQLCEDIDINAQLIYNNTRYEIPNQTRIVNNRPGVESTFLFNTATKEFSFRHPSLPLADTEILVGTFKNANAGYSTSDYIDIGCEVTINGMSQSKYLEDANLQLPSYINADIISANTKISDIKGNVLKFGLITDVHERDSHIKYLTELAKYGQLDFIIICGDIVSASESSLATTKAYVSKFAKSLREIKEPVFAARGNHDGFIDTGAFASSDYENIMIKSFKQNSIVSDGSMNGYYYQDFDKYKVRVIVTNASEDAENRCGWGATQVQWIAHYALNFESKGADATNWTVLFFSHQHMLAKYSSLMPVPHNADLLNAILIAFIGGTSYINAEKGVNVDYSVQGVIPLVAHFFGHMHYDIIDTVDGINHVCTVCSTPSKNTTDLPTGATSYDRTAGTDTEYAFDVFSVDLTDKSVTATRIGAGADRTFTY